MSADDMVNFSDLIVIINYQKVHINLNVSNTTLYRYNEDISYLMFGYKSIARI